MAGARAGRQGRPAARAWQQRAVLPLLQLLGPPQPAFWGAPLPVANYLLDCLLCRVGSRSPQHGPEEVPDPPSTFAALAAMGGGAFGAVAIAAIGVYGVFKMAFWVASETGRSLNATSAPAAAEGSGAPAAADGAPRPDVKAATPLEPTWVQVRVWQQAPYEGWLCEAGLMCRILCACLTAGGQGSMRRAVGVAQQGPDRQQLCGASGCSAHPAAFVAHFRLAILKLRLCWRLQALRAHRSSNSSSLQQQHEMLRQPNWQP